MAKAKTSVIQLYDGVPFSASTPDVIWFDTIAHQNQFWSTQYNPWMLRKSDGTPADDRYFTNLQLVLENRRIKLPIDYYKAMQINYMRYQNPSMGSKWFYCFVDSVTYISDGVTELHTTTDLWQTHMFDFVFDEATFISRLTVPVDSRWKYRQQEDIPFSPEYVYKAYTFNNDKFKPDQITMLSTANPSDGSNVQGGNYEGVYSGAKRYNFTSASDVNSAINNLTSHNKSASVVSLCITPSQFVDTAGKISTNVANIDVTDSTRLSSFQFTDEENYSVGATDYYKPQNMKMMQSPYNAFYLTDFQGDDAVLKYELFNINESAQTNIIQFEENGVFNGTFEGSIAPKNYEGLSTNYGKAMQVKCGTTCCWTYDAYQAELAQQYAKYSAIGDGILGGMNYLSDNASGIISGITNAVSNVAGSVSNTTSSMSENYARSYLETGNVSDFWMAGITSRFSKISGGTQDVVSKANEVVVPAVSEALTEVLESATSFLTGVKSSIDGIASSILSYMHSGALPLALNGNPQPSLMTSLAKTGSVVATSVLHPYSMKIRPQFARIMDSYFTLYGYKIASISTPNLNTRKVMNYIQTADCHLVPVSGAYITRERLEALALMFDAGVRVWHCYHSGSSDTPSSYTGFNNFLNQYRCAYIDNTDGYSNYAWHRSTAPVYRTVNGVETNEKPTSWFV